MAAHFPGLYIMILMMRFLKIFGFEKKNYDGKKIVFEDIFIKPHCVEVRRTNDFT
jgi:hypothetical protein